MKFFDGKYWICKSDLSVCNMQKLGVTEKLSKLDLDECFEICCLLKYSKVFVTGSKIDKKRQRHTVFVELEKFKMAVKWYIKKG